MLKNEWIRLISGCVTDSVGQCVHSTTSDETEQPPIEEVKRKEKKKTIIRMSQSFIRIKNLECSVTHKTSLIIATSCVFLPHAHK